ncbi:hypothetical protein [Methylobacterium marchantiae]|uniref:Uncharacterized protein n=1 Tax=Methylobacterium marchantiae TaxID=600331 RepID=A0ABW3WX53_9HYPH|nr:hypothetical protein AIGOOFII_4059 [Methylobacterium marchantiae]
MTQVALNMSVSDPDRFQAILKEAEGLGLVVHAAYEDLGIVSGSIDSGAVAGLRRISGLTLEPDRTVAAMPSPGRAARS